MEDQPDITPIGPERLDYQRQRAIEAERASVTFGMGTLRTALLVNAGAVIALVAFIGQLWGKDGVLGAVLTQAHWFFWGLVTAVLAIVASYLFVSLDAIREDGDFKKMLDGQIPPDRYSDNAPINSHDLAATLLVILALLSYAFFGVGAWGILEALR